MIPSAVQQHIRFALEEVLEYPISELDLLPVGGGSINLAYELQVNRQDRFFCKINSVSRYPAMFEKEKNGLRYLAAENKIRVPNVILSTAKQDYQVLVLEWIEQGHPGPVFWDRFGEQLAALHYVSATYFGFGEDNYMGALPQSNQRTGRWPEFFMLHRLIPQVQMAYTRGLLEKTHLHQFEALYQKLPSAFPPELPSLVHGDLWSGNFLCDNRQQPVLVDPALYFGHRSADLAMTTLFGGFEPAFYEAYRHHYPFPENQQEQWAICNLYPLLVHLNLFGKSYLADIEQTIRRY